MAVATTIDPDILAAKRERLHALKVQQAQFGRATPAHITTEIDDLEQQIAEKMAPATPALQYLNLHAIVTRQGQILAANTAATIIILLLLLVVLGRIVPETRQAQQPYATPAPTAGIAAPAITPITPIAGGSTLPIGGRP